MVALRLPHRDTHSPGGPDGVGASFDLHTKGWLPYTLTLAAHCYRAGTLDGFALTATGDLNGTGRWTFETDGPEVVITYDWRVSAAKPLLRRLSWLLKPAFSANHHWAMARGEESLKLELRRRRSSIRSERAGRQDPPSCGGLRRDVSFPVTFAAAKDAAEFQESRHGSTGNRR